MSSSWLRSRVVTVTHVDAGLDTAVADLVGRYVDRNPRSAELFADAADVMPGGNTRSVLHYPPFPLYVERGDGCRVWDVDGHGYLDTVGEMSAGLYGHSHPVIRRAIERAVAGGLSPAGPTTAELELAAAIRRRFSSIELVRFTNSGTEANLMALAVAAVHTGRRTVLAFDGGYHGGVLSFAHGVSPVNVPHQVVLAPFNDLAATASVAADRSDELAAIIVEPMQGSGGCIPGHPTFLAGLRNVADRTGALLIFDEVMTSRLAPGGMQGALGIRPDLTTLGKYLGGGMSFGAFGGRSDVMARFDPRRADALAHAGTFNNNVVSMAAGAAGLTEVYTIEEARRLDERGDSLRQSLNERFERAGVAMCCTGTGSLLNLHPVAGAVRSIDDLHHADQRRRDVVFYELLERGVYASRRGFIALSLPFGDAEIAELTDTISAIVDTHRTLLS